MSEAVINRRKSQLFLTQISPVHNTHDEVVKKTLKRGKFPQTKTGIIKMISLCLYLGSTLTWTLLKQQRDNSNIFYANISCIGIALAGGLLLFLLFSIGATINNPGRWIHSDIIFNLLMSVAVIVASAMALKNCNEAERNLSSALAISAASASICSCTAIFLMYRYIEDTPPPESKPVTQDPRKSIFA